MLPKQTKKCQEKEDAVGKHEFALGKLKMRYENKIEVIMACTN